MVTRMKYSNALVRTCQGNEQKLYTVEFTVARGILRLVRMFYLIRLAWRFLSFSQQTQYVAKSCIQAQLAAIR